jgi:fused signal recognition particle receptor
MFKSLKEKLNIFKKKAKEEIISDEDGAPSEPKPEVPKKKESKFMKKFRAKEEKKRKKNKIDPDLGPRKVDEEISLEKSISESGLSGEQLLKGNEPLVKESRGIFAKKISEKRLDEVLFELEMGLLESDVATPVVAKIKEYIKEELMDAKVDRKTDLDELIENALRTSIKRVLATQRFDFDSYMSKAKKPVVVMFVVVNGTGKTTAI